MAKVYGDEQGDKAQWAKLKGAPFKDKVEFFFTYYGILTAVVIVVLIFVISMTVNIIRNSRPVVIAGEFQGTTIRKEAEEDLYAVLADRFSLNMKKNRMDITYSVVDSANYEQRSAQTQKTFARLVAGDMDFLGAPMASFSPYMDPTDYTDCAFVDLNEVLDAETIAALSSEGRLVYYEMDDGSSFPYLILVDDSTFYDFFEIFLKDYYIGYTATGKHPEAFQEMISYLMIEN